MSRTCESCGAPEATLYAFYPAVLCPECVATRVAERKAAEAYREAARKRKSAESQPDPRMQFSDSSGMNLVKTLESGNQVFSTVEMIESPHAWENGQKRATGFHIEVDSHGEIVRKWEPSFDELAGHSQK